MPVPLRQLALRISAVALGLLALLWLIHTATTGPAAVLAIRWQPGVTGDARRAFEREHLLIHSERRGEVNWVYDLLDTSSGNIRSIVTDPRVADTGSVNRETFEVSDAPSDTASTSLLARIPVVRNPSVLGNLVLLLLAFALPGVMLWSWRATPRGLAALACATKARRWQRAPEATSRALLVAVLVFVALISGATRFLTLEMRLSGDDHFGLWIASAVMRGAVPNRDIFDAGVPLHWWMSLLGQWLSGYRVIGEVAIGVLFEAVAFTLAFWLTWRISRSLAVAAALLPIGLIVLLATKLYSYPKLFLYPLVLAAIWAYIARPTLQRTVALAATLATAFLFRHDHGLYSVIGASAGVMLQSGRRGREGAWRVVRLGICMVLLLSPWLLWIASTEGIVRYFADRADLSAEAGIAAARPSLGISLVGDAPWGRIDPLPTSRITITWTGLDDAARRQRERQYGLIASGGNETSRGYELRDTRIANIRRLIADPSIDDLAGIDVTSSTPADDPGVRGRWRREVPWLRATLLPGLRQAQNAPAWIFTLFALLTPLTLAALAWRTWRGYPERLPHERTFVASAAILLLVAEAGLMRKLGGFSDLTTLGMILGGWLLSLAWARSDSAPTRHPALQGVTTIASVALVVITLAAATSFVRLGTYFETYTEDHDTIAALGRLRQRASDLLTAYATSPPIDVYAPRNSTDDRILIRYFRECTNADDEIWELGGNFAWPYYAERRVVRHPYWFVGFKRSDEDQLRTIEWVRTHPAPLVFVKDGTRPLEWLERYPRVHTYVADRYRDVSTPALRALYDNDNHRPVWILADRTRTPTRMFEPLGLPCYR